VYNDKDITFNISKFVHVTELLEELKTLSSPSTN